MLLDTPKANPWTSTEARASTAAAPARASSPGRSRARAGAGARSSRPSISAASDEQHAGADQGHARQALQADLFTEQVADRGGQHEAESDQRVGTRDVPVRED